LISLLLKNVMGNAPCRKTVHANENFRRGNFTSADMKEADFSGSTFNGGYLEKAVAYKTNFTGIKDTYLLFASQDVPIKFCVTRTTISLPMNLCRCRPQ